MPLAVNPKTGETRFLDADGAWKPARTAVNPETQEALAFDGSEWKALPASKGVLNYIDDAVRSIAQGATFGFADEFAALMTSMTSDMTYEQALKKERAKDKKISKAISIPGEIAGGVASAVAAAPATAAGAAVTGLSKLPGLVKTMGAGAGLGGLAGAGTAEEGGRLEGAAGGAVLGAGTGAVLHGAVSAGRAIKGALTPKATAAADLSRAIARDADTPAALAGRAKAAQAERPGVATIADVGGENVKGLVERVAQTPGAGRTQVVPALTQRQQQQAARISDDLKVLTGTNKTAMETIDEVMTAREIEAKPLYDAAIAFDAKQVPEIVNSVGATIKTGWGKSIVAGSNFRKTLETEYGIDPRNIKDMPLMVFIDAFKKEADDLIGAASRSGNNNKARVIGKMKDDLLNVVDQFNPAYSTARKAWAGKSAYLEAVDEGRNVLSRNVSAEELAANFRTLSDAQKEAYRIGAVSSIINRMGSDPAKLGDMTKYLRSPEMLKKLAMIMPSRESAMSWLKRMEFEVSSSELTARALGNSATARRQAELADAQGIVGDLVVDALMNGTTAGLTLWNKITVQAPKWVRDTLRSRTDKVLADLLTNPARADDIMKITVRPGASSGTLAPAAATAGAVNALQ